MEEEPIFKTLWNNVPTLEWCNTGISAYDYAQLISWLKPFNDQQKPTKAQELTDNIIKEYFE